MDTKPILNFVIEPALLRRLDDFWHDNRFPTRAEAVRWLIQAGLDKKLTPKAAGKKGE
jgi:metal-responsive CopG/Arc/MetJ family transcriptional regulator